MMRAASCGAASGEGRTSSRGCAGGASCSCCAASHRLPVGG